MILWSDEQILVVNKPAGLPTLVDGYHPEAPNLVAILRRSYHPLWVVHRLDKETSGVIVFARSAAAHRALNLQFEHRETEKIYHALVHGQPEWEHRQVVLPLRPDGDRRHRTVIDPEGGKFAQTDLTVLERYPDRALIQAIPRTGRTHQIRAHLSALGHPIVGDKLYGGKEILPFKWIALNAFSLKIRHPVSAEEMKFEAPFRFTGEVT